jgi:hypothetical protein
MKSCPFGRFSSLSFVALAFLSHPAFAADPGEKSAQQESTGVHTVADALAKLNKSEANQPPLDARRKAGQKFGQCLAGKPWLHSAAVTFLLSGRERDGRKLADTGCFGEGMAAAGIDAEAGSFPVGVMRALIGDGLIRIDFRKAGPTDFSTVPPLRVTPPTEHETSTGLEPSILDKLGECAARLSPEAVRHLALTEAASDEETSEVRLLVPVYAQCLPPGAQLAFAPGVLRDASVLAYARLAYTQDARRDDRRPRP